MAKKILKEYEQVSNKTNNSSQRQLLNLSKRNENTAL